MIAEGEVEIYRQWPSSSSFSSPSSASTPLAFPSPPLPMPELLCTLGPGQAFGGAGFGVAAAGVGAGSAHGADGCVLVAKAKEGGGVRVWRAAGGWDGEPPARPRTQAERARVLSVLEHHPYFQGLGKREREAALARFFAVHVRKGEVVLAQGERGDNLYVLDAGRAEIVRRGGTGGGASGGDDDAGTVVAASVNPGAVFGEAAVLFDSTRGASVRALEDCRLWALGRLDAMALTGRGPPFSLREFFGQHASVALPSRKGKGEEERYMTYNDFYRALCPQRKRQRQQGQDGQSSPSSSAGPPPPIPLLLRALDPTCVRACMRVCSLCFFVLLCLLNHYRPYDTLKPRIHPPHTINQQQPRRHLLLRARTPGRVDELVTRRPRGGVTAGGTGRGL